MNQRLKKAAIAGISGEILYFISMALFLITQAEAALTFWEAMTVAGAGIIFAGYSNISKNGTWSEYYKTDVGPEHKARTEGKKPAVPWLLPAAGALLLNAGITELSFGLNGLGGYKRLQQAGLARAQVHVGPTWDGVGISMVF